jgi:hypothetical protein
LSNQDSNSQTKKCGTCRFWGVSDQFSPLDVQDDLYKPCGRIYHDKNFRNKKNTVPRDTEDFEENEQFAQELLAEGHKAVVVDSSGWFAVLKSNKDFGCPLHEEKLQ